MKTRLKKSSYYSLLLFTFTYMLSLSTETKSQSITKVFSSPLQTNGDIDLNPIKINYNSVSITAKPEPTQADNAFENTDIQIENMVFQGVGVRMVALVGALQALKDGGALRHVKRVAGVSSGSMTAALVALGYSTEDMKKMAMETDFASLKDKASLFRIKTKFGYYSGKKLEQLLRKYVSSSPLHLSADATFRDLHEKTATELYIFSADLNTYAIQELSFRTTPDVKIWEAVRSSIAVPIVFPPWKFTQGLNNGHLYVDGGIIYDFPIRFFDIPPFHDGSSLFNPKTLGFLVDNQAINQDLINLDYDSPLKTYLEAMYQMVVDGQVSVITLYPEEQKRILTIEINGDGSFALNNDQKLDLYNRGIKSAESYLQKNYPTTPPQGN